MKLENLIVQYLYKNKSVRLQDIGTFTIMPDVHIPAELDKDSVMPKNAISFAYDPKALPDEGLLEYVMEQTRKIRPLAISDLESFSNLNKQFINIGKPLVIDGLGEISRSHQGGDYEFRQSGLYSSRIETPPAPLKENVNEDISFSRPKPSGGKTALWIVLSLLALGLLGGIAYYFLNNRHAQELAPVPVAVDTAATKKTVVIDTVKKVDSTKIKADSIKPVSAAPAVNIAGDSSVFKVALKDFSTREGAEKYRFKLESYGHKLGLNAQDSSHYRVYLPIYKPATDSLRIRDSIKRFFGGAPYILH